jgi:sugar lactone lactonase YvrE
MTHATTFRRSCPPLIVLGALVAFGLTTGCGSSDDNSSPNDGGEDSSTDSTPPPHDGGDSGGDTPTDSGPKGNGTIGTVTPAANDPTNIFSPFDATPDPTGTTIYFTAVSVTDGPGVFSVPATGGTITKIAAGDPFVAPVGIAISLDGKQLFVADPGASTSADMGAIYVLPTTGGTPTALSGTDGTDARGVDVVQDASGSAAWVYFTGIESGGSPALMKVSTTGGSATTIAKGAPFVDPSGLAVTASGDAYVVDTVGANSNHAEVLKVSGGAVTVFASDIGVGYPAGIALSQDESAIIVSGIGIDTGTDVVLRFDLASKGLTTVTKGIDGFSESAGLHRAKNAEVYAWADSQANGGTVFVLTK